MPDNIDKMYSEILVDRENYNGYIEDLLITMETYK